jgi:hypothetical protein
MTITTLTPTETISGIFQDNILPMQSLNVQIAISIAVISISISHFFGAKTKENGIQFLFGTLINFIMVVTQQKMTIRLSIASYTIGEVFSYIILPIKLVLTLFLLSVIQENISKSPSGCQLYNFHFFQSGHHLDEIFDTTKQKLNFNLFLFPAKENFEPKKTLLHTK